MDDTDDDGQNGPQPEKPAVLNTDPNGLEVNSITYSINDKSLGAGEPIRVKEGQRVLFHLLNASAIENRRIALPGHKFKVIALDGNPVPMPQSVEALFLGAGERVDAIVEMNNPGVWILGATEDPIRTAGLGIVVEYANQHRQPQWIDPSTHAGTTPSSAPCRAQPARIPDHTIEMIFEKIPGGSGKFNTLLVNGKPYPHENEFVLKQGARYRLVFRNRTDDAHPLHLHRHQLELVEINGTRPPASSKTPSSSPTTAAPPSTSPPTNPASPSSTATSSSTWTTASKPSSATPSAFHLQMRLLFLPMAFIEERYIQRGRTPL